MTIEYTVDILQQMILQCLALVSPLLMAAVSIGVAISLFQTVTSIQEQTLTFAPKIIGVGLVGMALLPWMLRTSVDFTTDMLSRIAEMAP
ncbi:MAG: flagellar biosynthetic protein FliQ [Verrucomicrobiota bacterium JB022]|nr:flagellar biosynthetic protein FliQ [Verrucomicrobiota bacterium JB022]